MVALGSVCSAGAAGKPGAQLQPSCAPGGPEAAAANDGLVQPLLAQADTS
jgi:hypothetical protein